MARPLPLRRVERLRQLGNLVNLSTPTGLLVARLGRARVRRGPRGLLLGEGYRLKFPVAGAFTIGNVVITPSTWDVMLARFPRLLEHEEGHTWQYLWCGGLPFFPLYAASTAWSWVRTGDRAARSGFERSAGLDLGGYVDWPVRPVRVGLESLLTAAGERVSRARSRAGGPNAAAGGSTASAADA